VRKEISREPVRDVRFTAYNISPFGLTEGRHDSGITIIQQSEHDLVYERRSKVVRRRPGAEGVIIGSQALDLIVFRGDLTPPLINGFSIGSGEEISGNVLRGVL
jgi:hypothetical protein